MLLDDSLAYPEAQTGTFGIFGCKERLKDSGQVFRRDSAAIVGHGDPYPWLHFRCAIVPDANRDLTRHSHCFQSIQHQVGKDLAKFAGKSQQLLDVAVTPEDCDMLLLDVAAVYAQNFVKQAGHKGQNRS